MAHGAPCAQDLPRAAERPAGSLMPPSRRVRLTNESISTKTLHDRTTRHADAHSVARPQTNSCHARAAAAAPAAPKSSDFGRKTGGGQGASALTAAKVICSSASFHQLSPRATDWKKVHARRGAAPNADGATRVGSCRERHSESTAEQNEATPVSFMTSSLSCVDWCPCETVIAKSSHTRQARTGRFRLGPSKKSTM